MFEKIRDAYRKFSNCSSDLLDSMMPTYENALNAFLTFCETDELMITLTKPLKENAQVDVMKWYKDVAGTGKFPTFSSDDERLAFEYQLLLRIKNNEIDVA